MELFKQAQQVAREVSSRDSNGNVYTKQMEQIDRQYQKEMEKCLLKKESAELVGDVCKLLRIEKKMANETAKFEQKCQTLEKKYL